MYRSGEMQDILLWAGRLHLGDEAGVRSNSFYSGISIEFPIEAFPYDQQAIDALRGEKSHSVAEDPAATTIALELSEVRVYDGYPGHLATIFGFYPQDANSHHWEKREIS